MRNVDISESFSSFFFKFFLCYSNVEMLCLVLSKYLYILTTSWVCRLIISKNIYNM